jgi:ABC-type uncharacterized transport system permease subunit
MADGSIGLWVIPLAVLGGALRVSTPFLFVSLGECLTERSGRINLGLEGTLVMGAMSAFATSYLTGSPWLGVLAAGVAGMALGALHAVICGLPRVNDIAVGIALMLFGTGLAFFLGKPLIEPSATMLPAIELGWWSDVQQVRAALRINVLFLFGVALAPFLVWALKSTRWGLVLRTAGESADAALALGYHVNAIRPVDFFPASAARSCPSIIRAVGTKDCRADRASPRSRSSSSRAGTRCYAFGLRSSSAAPPRSGRPCNRSASAKPIICSMPRRTS